jgi:hypothetical protein
MTISGSASKLSSCRRAVAWAVVLGVAAVHFLRAGSYLRGTLYRLYYSYASDVLLPLAAYSLLCIVERNLGFLRDWRAKAILVFAAASTAEILQGLGVPMLGRTFDPRDFVMYGVGVLLAVLGDRLVLPVLCGSGQLPRVRQD